MQSGSLLEITLTLKKTTIGKQQLVEIGDQESKSLVSRMTVMHQWTSEGKGDIEPRANCLISLISSNTIVILPLPWFSISMALLSDRLNWLFDSAAEGKRAREKASV